ncbi:MAG TPA: type II secretion system protein [Vitreimonas sp.]|nr:type II secretion system protein [Vitreimonas sp.]
MITRLLSLIRPRRQSSSGITMIELLIVAAIIGVLAVVLFLALQLQLARARDARRKADLERIRVAFEDYYNDNRCYPEENSLDNCNSADFAPYLASIPCDPLTKDPYRYIQVDESVCKKSYRVLAILEDGNDHSISAVGCSGPEGCGYGEGLNYGISAGIPVPNDGSYTPPASAAPTQPNGEYNGVWACAPGTSGACNNYGDPQNAADKGCPQSFSESNCQNMCIYSEFRCDE